MTGKPVVLFYVQHLWGVGHVYRATRVAHGMVRAGLEVHLVWGGTQIPGFDFSGTNVHHLPPVRTADASFGDLLHGDGRPFTDGDKEARCNTLLGLFADTRPDILMTEAYPFGRRQMRFELVPLLKVAREASWNPMIVASIRDIMQEDRKEKRVLESNALVDEFFDLVMVHGDETLIAIEETLQGAEGFRDKVRYSGLVTPEPIEGETDPENQCDVLVSVGGGAFGQNLTRTALKAKQYSRCFADNWLITAGTELSDQDFRHLQDNCPAGIRVVRQIQNLALAMKGAQVSVSHAGYNTVADILRAGCRSVLYPYTGGRETEQLRRAQIMTRRGIAVMLPADELTPQSLANAIDEAAVMNPPAVSLKLDGAQQTGQILRAEFEKYRRTVD